MLDATGSIASKVNGKTGPYYVFLLTNTIKNVDPLPLLEINNSYDEKPIKWYLDAFLTDEKGRYGQNVSTIPLIFTCDMSWPIIKAAICVFNNKSIEKYCQRSYVIVTRNTGSKEQPISVSRNLIHFCLSHVLNSFYRR